MSNSNTISPLHSEGGEGGNRCRRRRKQKVILLTKEELEANTVSYLAHVPVKGDIVELIGVYQQDDCDDEYSQSLKKDIIV